MCAVMCVVRTCAVLCVVYMALLTKVRTWQCLHCSVLWCGPMYTAAGERTFPLSYTQETRMHIHTCVGDTRNTHAHTHVWGRCVSSTQRVSGTQRASSTQHIVWCMRREYRRTAGAEQVTFTTLSKLKSPLFQVN